jgi:phosphoenolpyruvate-protein kinase (PTS system EI component)
VLPDVRRGCAPATCTRSCIRRARQALSGGAACGSCSGMAQMAASVVAVVLLFGVGVTAISLTAVVVASSLTSLSVMRFGSRRNRRDRV